jgi:hypothetical protein
MGMLVHLLAVAFVISGAVCLFSPEERDGTKLTARALRAVAFSCLPHAEELHSAFAKGIFEVAQS